MPMRTIDRTKALKEIPGDIFAIHCGDKDNVALIALNVFKVLDEDCV